MTSRPSDKPIKVRTVPIPDPGELTRYLTPGAVAWLRRGDGMIGLGEWARHECATPAEADSWWQALSSSFSEPSISLDCGGVGPIAFGSFTFDPNHTRETSVLIVPRVIIGRRKGCSWLTILEPTDPAEPAVMPKPTPKSGRQTTVSAVSENLNQSAWLELVQTALVRIADGQLDKVVLARGVQLAGGTPISVPTLVSDLSAAYPTCWTYSVAGLIGASPEMLIRRENGLATSRVLAGTIRRNGEQDLDLKLAHALARSGKNLIEHELAVESVARALAPFCSGMNVPDAPYVLELPNVLHLASDVTAVAHQDVSVLRLAGELHPSAAVCGTPTATARSTIAELERLDRGRYSGPVGWVDAHGDGEFAIALRCGRITDADPTRITVYAGCGIVSGSDPDEEYAETKAKLLPMLDALGVQS